jgi:hypothetical protein
VQDFEPARVAEVEHDAPLPAVRLLHHEVDAAGRREEPGGDEPALRVAGHRMLDLDDVRAPVGEHGTAGRHEPPLGDLDHANAFEHAGHAAT